MSRDLIYRVSIQTNDARRAAANIRGTFERELRQITLGKLDTSGLTQAVTEAHKLRQELEAAGRASSTIRPPARGVSTPSPSQLPADSGFLFSGIDGAISQVQGLVASYIGLQGVIAAIDLSKLGTQALRTYASLNILSGGGKQTEEVLNAIQKASNGTVTELEAAGVATQGFALKLARTPAEFEKLTRAAREVVQVSPIINDVSDALSQLALFAANENSFVRADQLGLAVSEVKDRMAELRRENDALSGSQAKLLASVQLLDEKYGATLDTIEAQATGLERLRVAFEDARVAFATGDFGFTGELFSIDKPAGNIANMISILTGNYSDLQAVTDRIKGTLDTLENRKTALLFPEDTQPQIEKLNAGFDSYRKAVEEVNRALAANAPGADKYKDSLANLSLQIVQTGGIDEQQIAQLQELHNWFNEAALAVTNLAEAEKLRADNKIAADQFEKTRQGTIFEQQPAIESALASRAAKATPTAGLEQTIALYRQQKALVDQAIQQLIDSGVSDQNELAIRVSAITSELLAPFDELEARASEIDLMSALGNFTDVSTALSGLNAGFVDFLPGLSAARDELVTLSNEMALTGQLSDEQAARLEYLSAVAYSVADGGSALNAVVSELGGSFLESNAYAAELVNQLFMAEAAYAQGAITGDIYAGIMATLTGQLLTVAQGAGIATGAIMQLNAAQSGMASIGGLAIGGSIANRIQTQQQSAGREQNRREQERYNKDLARSQERSAGRAGKLLEDGAKKANQELKSALDKVPGLFSTTQVTEQDMKDAELGVYQEKADEYLRRLRDEIQNGHDWEDVSLEEARAGLERAGLEVGATAEQTLTFLERAINDSSLYSAVENIPIFINEEAVKLTQELQSKSEEGRKNIYEYFGIQVDEAVGAATGGGGGAAIEVKPPEFVDIDPLTEGLQTGLDEYVATTGAAIKEQVATAKNLFFDPADLFGTADGAKTLEETIDLSGIEDKINSLESTFDLSGIQAQFDSFVGPKPEITVTADPAATALMPVITGQVQPTVQVQFAGATVGAQSATAPATMTITPTIDTTGIQAQLDALTAPTLEAKISLNAENLITINGLVSALTPAIVPNLAIGVGALSDFTVFLQDNIPTPGVETTLTVTVEEIGLFKQLIEGIVKPTVQVGLTTTEEAMNTFATDLETNMPTVGVETNLSAGVGTMSEFTVYLQDNIPTPGVPVALAVTIEEIQLFEKLVSGLVHPTVTVALSTPQQQTNEDGSQGANAITPLITDINTQIRSSQEQIKNQGITIAMILMAGIAAHFQGGQTTGGEQASTPLSDALMTNLSTQMTAAQGMFYAVGFLPAQSVESGFKGYGYTGLSSGLLDALTTGIRADADSYMQRGATIAGYVQAGMNQQFSAETGVRSAIAAGAAWGGAFMRGVFDALNGAGFVDQITTNVIDGITGELEQP